MHTFDSIEEIKENLPINSVVNGDCLEAMKFIKDKSIDSIICDLPYAITAAKFDVMIDLNELWKHYKRIIKPNGIIVLFGATPFDKILGCSNLEWLKYELIYEKS